MTSGFRALWWLFRPTPQPSHPQMPWWRGKGKLAQSLLWLGVALFFLAIMFSVISQAYRYATSPPKDQSPSNLLIVGNALSHFNEFAVYRQYTNVNDTAPNDPIDVALVGPDSVVDVLSAALAPPLKQVNFPCSNCVVLRWYEGLGWYASYESSEKSQDTKTNPMILRTTYLLKEALLSQSATKAPAVALSNANMQAAMLGVSASTLVLFSHAIILAFAWMLVLSMGVRGYQWDLWRATGKLEPLVMSHHEAWVLFGSQLLRQIVVCVGVFGLVLALAWFYTVPLSWTWALCLWALLPFLSLVVGLWGMLATVLFHHAKGRMFARFALSPIIIGLVWMSRVLLLFLAMRVQTPFVAWAHLQQLDAQGYWLLAGIPVCGVLATGLMWAIDARIGRRRQGLRKTQ